MSKLLLFAIVTIIVFIILLIWLFGPRTFKTIILISVTSPYERYLEDAETILVLGDSTGYGTGVFNANDSIAGQIGADFKDFAIVNRSKNGLTIGDLLPIAQKIEGKKKLILLQIGANDILQDRDISTVEQELREIISTLVDHTDHLVMMSSGNVGGASAFSGEKAKELEERSRTFRELFQRLASQTDLVYVDLFVEPAKDPFVIEPDKYVAVDGLHPSKHGYKLWYQSLKPVISERLIQ